MQLYLCTRKVSTLWIWQMFPTKLTFQSQSVPKDFQLDALVFFSLYFHLILYFLLQCRLESHYWTKTNCYLMYNIWRRHELCSNQTIVNTLCIHEESLCFIIILKIEFLVSFMSVVFLSEWILHIDNECISMYKWNWICNIKPNAFGTNWQTNMFVEVLFFKLIACKSFWANIALLDHKKLK